MYDLSFLIPGIRVNNWIRVYDSFKKASNKLNTEIIFCGPQPPPSELQSKDDVVFIEDWGNPNRASQICLLNAAGERILLGCDDGYFLPGMLDHLFDTLDEIGPRQPNHIAGGKYLEGGGGIGGPDKFRMDKDSYYYLNTHPMTASGIKDNWFIGCYFLLDRKWLLNEFGGYNMMFEGSAIAGNELAIRIQRTNAKLNLSKYQIIVCDWMPNTTGDHAPMHFAQTTHDEPLYKQWIPQLNDSHKLVDKHDWINVEAIWKRRFNVNLKCKYEFDKKKDTWRAIYEKA